MRAFISEVWDWADEGTRHDIPLCCGVRFGIGCARPKPLCSIFPRLARLSQYGPRRLFAAWDGQGYVPCEAHLLLFLLTGYRPSIKQD